MTGVKRLLVASLTLGFIGGYVDTVGFVALAFLFMNRRLLDQDISAKGWEVVTVHMMGTAAMGTDRSAAVTDPHGLVYDADRLMVADASLFPTPIGVNPMETIMALATRCAAHVIDNSRRLLS